MALWSGSRLATRINGCISGRSLTTIVQRRTIEEIEYEFNKNMNLYLCFNEAINGLNRVVVRSFNITTEYYTSGWTLELEAYMDNCIVVASKRPKATPILNPWTRLGDKLLLHSGGQRISFIDTYKRYHEFENSSRRKTTIKSFRNDKSEINWGEIDGKLYCIDKNVDNIFEVLDPEDDTDWRRLSDHPNMVNPGTLFLNESKKIISWDRNGSGTYCYDVEAPEIGWKEVNYDLHSHGARPFVVQHRNHPEFSDFHFLFSYDPLGDDPLLVFPFIMSNEWQSLKAICKSPIKLPEICYDYLGNRSVRTGLEFMFKGKGAVEYEFLNLGEGSFGLVLHKYPYRGPDPNFEKDPELKGRTGGIVYLTYKYSLHKENNEWEFFCWLCTIQHLRYCPRTCTSDVSMAGAFRV